MELDEEVHAMLPPGEDTRLEVQGQHTAPNLSPEVPSHRERSGDASIK